MWIWKKPEEAVPLLLALLHKAKEEAEQGAGRCGVNGAESLFSKFDNIETKLNSMRHVFPKIKSWEKTIMEQFCVLALELDTDIFRGLDKISEAKDKLDLIENNIMELMQLISGVDMRITGKLLTMSSKRVDHLATQDFHHRTVCQEWVDLGIEDKILGVSYAMSSFIASFHCLSGSQQAKMCSLSLSIFPKNSIIEKKPLIYWWIGEGLVLKSQNKTAEEVGEHVFQELLNDGFIRPSSENKSLSVSSFVVDPWIHRMLILMAKENSFLEFDSQGTPCNGKRRAFLLQGNPSSYSTRNGEREEDVLTVFNVNEQYLMPTKPEWLSKLKKVEVLQMGRWQNSVTHHIEVENQMLLNDLGSQKHLKYLSLRGISRIETLPPSISKLISLRILDLRACHNLEKLPLGISRLKNLTHLDVSGCYLLESMPKGLEQLHALQVVKGFVIGKAEKNSCEIYDLRRLENLRKLSIRVGNQGETQQDNQLESLATLSALCILTISWGDVSFAQGKSISLPPTLTKLDLRCVPFDAMPEWLWPSMLPSKLEKLYIKGGKLKSLEHKDSLECWKVKFLRLKYLKNLKIEQGDLVRLFPDYVYLEKISCDHEGDITLNRAG